MKSNVQIVSREAGPPSYRLYGTHRHTRAGPQGSADQEVMRVRGGFVLLLLGYLISLTLCAEARPPDPTWIPGIYDDDDDVVCLLTSGSGAIEAGAFAKARPLLPVAGWVSALESDWPLIFPGFSPHSRAPPAS